MAVNFTGLSSAFGANSESSRRSVNGAVEGKASTSVKSAAAAAAFSTLAQSPAAKAASVSANVSAASAKTSSGAGAASQFASAVQEGDANGARKAMQQMLEELALISSVQSMLSPAGGEADTGLYSPKRSATSAVRDLLANPHFQRLQDVLEEGDSSQIKQAWSDLVGGK